MRFKDFQKNPVQDFNINFSKEKLKKLYLIMVLQKNK